MFNENIELEEDSDVKNFVGEYHPEHYLLNKQEPIAVGPLDLQAYLFEHKAQQAEALKAAKQVILDVSKDFESLTGRHYGLFEEYNLDDAEIAIVCMNSTAGTIKFVVDNLRKKGIKAGLLKIRVYRPFPGEEVAKALSHLKAVAVLDKSDSLNAIGGALFEDVSSSMYVNNSYVPMCNYIYGIGGRDTTTKDIESVYTDLIEIAKNRKVENPYRYLGLRSGKQSERRVKLKISSIFPCPIVEYPSLPIPVSINNSKTSFKRHGTLLIKYPVSPLL